MQFPPPVSCTPLHPKQNPNWQLPVMRQTGEPPSRETGQPPSIHQGENCIVILVTRPSGICSSYGNPVLLYPPGGRSVVYSVLSVHSYRPINDRYLQVNAEDIAIKYLQLCPRVTVYLFAALRFRSNVRKCHVFTLHGPPFRTTVLR